MRSCSVCGDTNSYPEHVSRPNDIKANQDSKQGVTAQEPCPHNSQTQNNVDHHEVLRTARANRKSKTWFDMASNFMKNDCRNIAKICHAAFFVLFLVFQLLFIIGVVSMLLKAEQTPDYWNDQHFTNVTKQFWKK